MQDHAHMHHHMQNASSESMEAMPGMDSALDPCPAACEVSGASWQPDSLPHEGIHQMSGEWMLIGKSGYPKLFQTGETADGNTHPVDWQHPHDPLTIPAATYSLPFSVVLFMRLKFADSAASWFTPFPPASLKKWHDCRTRQAFHSHSIQLRHNI